MINTLIYSGSYLLSSVISGEKPNVKDLFMAATGGILNGMVSGWNDCATIIGSFFATLLSYSEEFFESIFG